MLKSNEFQVVIGLEVHIQLLTESKLFSSDPNTYGSDPNTNVHVITLGHPGTLPRLNKKAVEFAIKMGLACNCEISRYNIFDRKNYFYPDLPKGFQTTQDRTPIGVGGFVAIEGQNGHHREIQLNRIHLEEDAGKSIHIEGETDTLIDLNRAGVPLIELVTEPDIYSSSEAMNFLNEIRRIVDFLEICDGNMEEGSLRSDANISVKRSSESTLGKKVEIKNMNSVRNVGRAIEYEYQRQVQLLQEGKTVVSETRLFNADKGTTIGMRTKEELNDYRYFPEPDLSPFEVNDEWLNAIRESMPELPHQIKSEFVNVYQLPLYEAGLLTESREMAKYTLSVFSKTDNYKAAANWIIGPVKSYLNERKMAINVFPIQAERLAKLVDLVDEGLVSFSIASQRLLPYLVDFQDDPKEAAQKLDLIQVSDDESIRPRVVEILHQFPDKVKAYHNGKKGLIGMFMGEVMKETKNSVDPKIANRIIGEVLNELKKE